MRFTIAIAGAAILAGCAHPPEITSVPASRFNRCEPPGMPFYLPKPLLVVSKNVRHIDEPKTGLTDPAPIPNAFDDQASYANIKANTTVPGSGTSTQTTAPDSAAKAAAGGFDKTPSALPQGWRGAMTPAGRVEDGLSPDSFYTYQIVFIPDLSQKFGLNIRGNPGEVRAAMNLVNGWMYTGMGPYYLKNSSTAQNIMSVGVASMFAGRGVADVLNSVSGLASAAGAGGQSGRNERSPAGVINGDDYISRVTELAKIMNSQTLVPKSMLNFAEVAIYEPTLNDQGGMDWKMIAQHGFERQYFTPDMDPTTAALLGRLIGNIGGVDTSPNENPGGSQSNDGGGSDVKDGQGGDKEGGGQKERSPAGGGVDSLPGRPPRSPAGPLRSRAADLPAPATGGPPLRAPANTLPGSPPRASGAPAPPPPMPPQLQTAPPRPAGNSAALRLPTMIPVPAVPAALPGSLRAGASPAAYQR